jgi:predicted secreted hydrolase
MKTLLLLLALSTAHAAEWRAALPGWQYEFPRDHRTHREFKTEWWYFTGNIESTDGRRFGYQLTFFRQGIRPPSAAPAASRFVVDDLKFSHFALSDLSAGRFRFRQKLARGAFGEAGFGDATLAWIDDWTLRLDADGAMSLTANDAEFSIAFDLASLKPWTVHGENGVSQKALGEGRASHYYSGTRMKTRGTLSVDGRTFAVNGESWFDHEWATNQLTPAQVGWDWFSVQLDNGSELMLYRMRNRDGGSDPASSGTFIAQDGRTRHLTRDDFQLTPLETWTSKTTGGRYPIAWKIAVPSLALELRVKPALPAQELVLQPIAYWEGAIEVTGSHTGRGYLELTGYAGALVGLSN